MFPLTIAGLFKQKNGNGFDAGRQDFMQLSREGGLAVLEWAARGATQSRGAGALASDSSQMTVSARLGVRGNYGARTRNPQSWKQKRGPHRDQS